MKHIFFFFFSLPAFCVGMCTQSKTIDFASTMTLAPIDKKTCITNVIYQDGRFDSIEKRIVEVYHFNRDNNIEEMSFAVDEAKLINYKLDTLVILSSYYIPAGSVSMTIKTGKGVFDIVHNTNGGYRLRSLEDSYVNIPEDVKNSDFLLYESIFTWNIDLLIRLIQSSGGLSGSEYSMSATRILLKNNQVLKKDIVNFKPAVRWTLK